jgi:hypothetical protein
MNSYLLEDINAENREYRVYAHFQGEFLTYNEQQGVDSDGTPELGFDGVGFASEDHLDPQVLLEPLEKKFDLRACFIEQRDFEGRKVKVVGEEDESLVGIGIDEHNATQFSRIRFLGSRDREPDGLIANHAGARHHRMTPAAVELKVGFGPGDKERRRAFDAPQTGEVDVSAIKEVERARFEDQRIEPVDVVDPAIGDMHQHRDRSVQIEQRVHLDRALFLAEPRPGENCQTQINRGRVDRVNGAVDVDAERLVGIQLTSASDEQQGQVFIDPPIAGRVSVGQGAASDRAAQPQVVELVAARAQTVFDISEALPEGNLRKGHAQKLVPAREPRSLILTTILRDNPAKVALGNKVDDLGEYKASDMHNIETLQKSSALERSFLQQIDLHCLPKAIFQKN